LLLPNPINDGDRISAATTTDMALYQIQGKRNIVAGHPPADLSKLPIFGTAGKMGPFAVGFGPSAKPDRCAFHLTMVPKDNRTHAHGVEHESATRNRQGRLSRIIGPGV
jgi:hypothetical protein